MIAFIMEVRLVKILEALAFNSHIENLHYRKSYLQRILIAILQIL